MKSFYKLSQINDIFKVIICRIDNSNMEQNFNKRFIKNANILFRENVPSQMLGSLCWGHIVFKHEKDPWC